MKERPPHRLRQDLVPFRGLLGNPTHETNIPLAGEKTFNIGGHKISVSFSEEIIATLRKGEKVAPETVLIRYGLGEGKVGLGRMPEEFRERLKPRKLEWELELEREDQFRKRAFEFFPSIEAAEACLELRRRAGGRFATGFEVLHAPNARVKCPAELLLETLARAGFGFMQAHGSKKQEEEGGYVTAVCDFKRLEDPTRFLPELQRDGILGGFKNLAARRYDNVYIWVNPIGETLVIDLNGLSAPDKPPLHTLIVRDWEIKFIKLSTPASI